MRTLLIFQSLLFQEKEVSIRKIGASKIMFLAIFCLVLTVPGLPASASDIALDKASDPVYDDGWQSGDNGGFGWGSGWVLSATIPLPESIWEHLLETSTGNGDGDDNLDGDIDTPTTEGRSWGLYSGNGAWVYARRTFAQPLQVGQTFSVDLDSGSVFYSPGAEGTVNVAFRSSNGSYVFAMRIATISSPVGTNWSYTDFVNASNADTGVAGTDEGLRFDFTLTGPDTYELALTPRGGSSTRFSGFLNGNSIYEVMFSSTTPGIEGLASENDAYFFNSMAIRTVPEPGDIDANGVTDALTDGLLYLRYLFGFRGAALIDSAVAADCIRCTSEEIEDALRQLAPNTP